VTLITLGSGRTAIGRAEQLLKRSAAAPDEAEMLQPLSKLYAYATVSPTPGGNARAVSVLAGQRRYGTTRWPYQGR
jgi:hypothetical protein